MTKTTQALMPPPMRIAWFMWGLGALLYLLGFFQRVAPAVMTAELMRDFNISASALGGLSAFYFYSYVAMQVPTGILADTWGPRRLLSSGALVAAIGTALFALAPTLLWASIGRFLIGGSVSVAFVAILKLATNWFPPSYFAIVSGVALCCGMIGAVSAGTPLHMLMEHFSWRDIMLATALVALSISVATWVLARDYPHETGYADWVTHPGGTADGARTGVVAGLAEVFRYRNTWLLFLIPSAPVGALLTFAGLWGVPFLTTHYDLPTSKAAFLTSSLLVAMALGGLLFAWLSNRWGSRKPVYIFGVALALAGWIVAFYVRDLSLFALTAVLLVTGFSSGCMMISFAFAKESVPMPLAGTISGVINMGVMIGPMWMQPAVGRMLDHKWQGAQEAGIRLYGLEAYQAGFAMMLAWIALALVLLFFTHETNCRQVR
jgi:MFS family permease